MLSAPAPRAPTAPPKTAQRRRGLASLSLHDTNKTLKAARVRYWTDTGLAPEEPMNERDEFLRDRLRPEPPSAPPSPGAPLPPLPPPPAPPRQQSAARPAPPRRPAPPPAAPRHPCSRRRPPTAAGGASFGC